MQEERSGGSAGPPLGRDALAIETVNLRVPRASPARMVGTRPAETSLVGTVKKTWSGSWGKNTYASKINR
jgi:hypothetical protein